MTRGMPRINRLASQACSFRSIGWPTLVIAIVCLTFWTAEGQPPQPTKGSLTVPQAQPNLTAELTAIEGRLTAIESTLNRTSIDSRLAEIRAAIDNRTPPSTSTTVLPSIVAALAGLLGVIAGGWLNGRLQKALSDKQAKLQIGSTIIDWKLKQLSLLYGPLRALLGQSFALYRGMNEVLQKLPLEHKDKFKFRLESIQNATDPDKKEFQIQTPTGWTRLVLLRT